MHCTVLRCTVLHFAFHSISTSLTLYSSIARTHFSYIHWLESVNIDTFFRNITHSPITCPAWCAPTHLFYAIEFMMIHDNHFYPFLCPASPLIHFTPSYLSLLPLSLSATLSPSSSSLSLSPVHHHEPSLALLRPSERPNPSRRTRHS
jgi:hypothetical protein